MPSNGSRIMPRGYVERERSSTHVSTFTQNSGRFKTSVIEECEMLVAMTSMNGPQKLGWRKSVFDHRG